MNAFAFSRRRITDGSVGIDSLPVLMVQSSVANEMASFCSGRCDDTCALALIALSLEKSGKLRT